jgi:uncharacterized RDD family membrane protein YckC
MQVVCVKCSRALEYSGACPLFCAYCGQALPARDHTPSATETAATVDASVAGLALPVPETVAGYRIGRLLGAGGMGAVYEAEESATGRRVALKLIRPEFAGSPDTVERFRQEGRIAGMVAHPRCVFVHAVDEEAGRPYIVMELMPGDTLKDLVAAQGPLPVETATAKIFDVIEGLHAAHRLQVIHRDVKPSNCFLEPDGRVKVGDFGLAKSLVQDGHITKSGAFVGTPHFASPEQIRGEPIDVQTDVYSVAATFYYLLTGQPPFGGHDSAATLARIVSEEAPPPRSLRPDLSPALERAIQRGLERDRNERWPDLEAFRQALVALAPEPLSAQGQARRVLAYALDATPLVLVGMGVALSLEFVLAPAWASLIGRAVIVGLLLGYFVVAEHTWGQTIGKWFMGLRVCMRGSSDVPGWRAAAVRAVLCVGMFQLGTLIAASWLCWTAADRRTAAAYEEAAQRVHLYVSGSWTLVGIALAMSTMRARHGFLCLHDVASDTRVVEHVEPRPRQHSVGSGWLLSVLQGRRMNQGPGQPAAVPQRLAGFTVRAVLKWTPSDKVVLGEDAALGRRVFLWLRPQTAPALTPARRAVGRSTRLRWLGCGEHGDLQWDAMLMPLGCPLPEYVNSEGALPWRQTRALLDALAGELSAGMADGTMPATLAVAQVWAQDDGAPQLADLPLTATAADEDVGAGAEQARALTFLGRVAVLALEGEARANLTGTLPADARLVCERLLGRGAPFATVQEFRDALRQTAGPDWRARGNGGNQEARSASEGGQNPAR